MQEVPKISDSEWQIMKVLWNQSPLTASEIIKSLKPITSWSPKTIHTLINRLVNKGAIEVNRESSQFQYSPIVSEGDGRTAETKSFLAKVYDGSLHLLVANFLKDEKLNKTEIEKLREILNEGIKDRGDR